MMPDQEVMPTAEKTEGPLEKLRSAMHSMLATPEDDQVTVEKSAE